MKFFLSLLLFVLISCGKNKIAPSSTSINYYKQLMDTTATLKLTEIRQIDGYNLSITDGKRGYLYLHFKGGGDTTWQELESQDISAIGALLREKFVGYNRERREIFAISQSINSSPVAFTR